MCCIVIQCTTCLQKETNNILYIFDKSKRIVVIFGKHCLESNAKLIVGANSRCPPYLFNAAIFNQIKSSLMKEKYSTGHEGL